jgi:SAM-dependent methyltransferase
MISYLKALNRRQTFFPGWLGLFTNPFYFARKGLWVAIESCSCYVHGKVLDVGCGSKPYQELFKVDSYTGLDYRKEGGSVDPSVDYYYDGGLFPFQDEIYDSCICTEVLEHVFDPDQFLSELNRVLTLGGVLLVTVPFVWDEHDQPYDYARYSSYGLTYLLKEHGFETMMHQKTMDDLRCIFQLGNAYIHKTILSHTSGITEKVLTALLCSPVNMFGSIVGKMLPRNSDLYLDNVIVAKKIL